MVAIRGLPLTGKTTLARELMKRLNVHFIDIDDGPARCAPAQEENPLRSDEARARERRRMTVAYTTMHASIRSNLENGFSVIVVATYSREANEKLLREAVRAGGGTLRVLWCIFDDTREEVERRVSGRLTRGEIGGCRSASHYFDDKSRYEETIFPCFRVNTSSPLTEEDFERIIEFINS